MKSPQLGKDTSVVAKQESAPLGPVEPGFKRFSLTKLSRTTSEIVETKRDIDYEVEQYTVSTACVQTSLEEDSPDFDPLSRTADAPYPSHMRVKVADFGPPLLDDTGGWDTVLDRLAMQVMDDVEFDSFLDDYTEAIESNLNLELTLVQLLNAIFDISRHYDDSDQEPPLKIRFSAQPPSPDASNSQSRPVCVALTQRDDIAGNSIGWNNALMILDIQDSWADSNQSHEVTEEEEVLHLLNRTSGPNDNQIQNRSGPLPQASATPASAFSPNRKRRHAKFGPSGDEPLPKRQRRTLHLHTPKSAQIPLTTPALGVHHLSHAPTSSMSTDALEAFSVVGNRRYILGISICGLAARFWYFDRAGTISTNEVALESAEFVSMVLALRFATPYQLGFEPCIYRPALARSSSHNSVSDPALRSDLDSDRNLSTRINFRQESGGGIDQGAEKYAKMTRWDQDHQDQLWSSFDSITGYQIDVQGRTYTLDRVLHITPCLYGRGTATYAAHPCLSMGSEGSTDEGKGETIAAIPDEVVLKLSWLPASWPDEGDPLQLAQKAGVKGVAKLYASRIVTRLSRGVRGRLIGDRYQHIGEHYRDRELRIQVIGPVCVPLHSILAAGEIQSFKTAFISLVKAHRELYERARVLHRDISLNNLMVELANHSAGILIDLDIAQCLPPRARTLTPETREDRHNGETTTAPNAGQSSTQENPTHPQYHGRSVGVATEPDSGVPTRAPVLPGGTVAFRALDLCQDEYASSLPHHLYRHDLESFFYVLTWMVAHFHPDRPLDTREGNETINHMGRDISAEENSPRSGLPKSESDSSILKSSSRRASMFSQWHKGSWTDIRTSKEKFLHSSSEAGEGDQYEFFPARSSLSKTWLPALRAMFREGYDDNRRGEVDEETLGGHVTYEKFIAILEGSSELLMEKARE